MAWSQHNAIQHSLARFTNDISCSWMQIHTKIHNTKSNHMFDRFSCLCTKGICIRNDGIFTQTEFNRISKLLSEERMWITQTHTENRNGPCIQLSTMTNNGNGNFVCSQRHSIEIIIYWNIHVTMTWKLMFSTYFISLFMNTQWKCLMM